MAAKNIYKLIFDLFDDQAHQMIIETGKPGFSVRKLYEIITNDITDDEAVSYDPERANLAKKWFEKLSEKYYKPTFLTYLLGLSGGDLREFIINLLFLKQKQEEIKKANKISQQMEEGLIKDMDEASLSELRQICDRYGIKVDEKNRNGIKTCLEEEQRNIRSDMYAPDMGFEPDNQYSAVDVVGDQFETYCKTYGVENADINEELKKVFDWLEENEKYFQSIECD